MRKIKCWSLYPTIYPDGLLTVIRPLHWNANEEACDRQENAMGWCAASAPHFNPWPHSDRGVTLTGAFQIMRPDGTIEALDLPTSIELKAPKGDEKFTFGAVSFIGKIQLTEAQACEFYWKVLAPKNHLWRRYRKTLN